MNQKNVVIALCIILAVGVVGYFALTKNQTPTPQTQQVVFATQGQCEQETGKPCSSQMCDNIPPGKTFEEVCGKDFKKGWVPTTSTQSQTITIDGRKMVDITLKVDAPFSTATLTIQENGAVIYSATQRGQAEIQDSGTLTMAQVNELVKFIEETDFLAMKNRTKDANDPEDGSTYTISLRILPQGDPKLAFPGTHSVSCYQFSCEHDFLRLKDEIIKLWGKDILEVGV